jgi:hypothetical protein
VKYLGLSMFLSSTPLNGQILQDTAALNLVRKDINHIYNLQFDKAREVYNEVIRLYPEHPIVFLLKGLINYWENYPMLQTTPSHVSFEEDMRQCIALSETNNNPDYKAEYVLADLCARSMLLMYYDDNSLIMEVIPLTKVTYKQIRHATNLTSYCTDLYYFTGLYNYYRDVYPKAYPVYKSLALLFPPGNKENGLKELQTAANNSVVLRAEALSLLTWIFLSFENKLNESLYYCKALHELYPENELYLTTYIRNLLLMKNYDEAEKLISGAPVKTGKKFYQAQFLILKGILQEKKYFNYNLALGYYNEGIKEISSFGDYGNEFASYAYFGLSRISEINDEKRMQKIYKREALKLAAFKKINFDK